MAHGTKCLHLIKNYVHEEGDVEIPICNWQNQQVTTAHLKFV